MKKLFNILLFLLFSLPSWAVLKEKDMESTLGVLRVELTEYHNELVERSQVMMQRQKEMGKQMRDIYERANQNALMLYSQKPDYLFDLTYACHEATEMYHQFSERSLPFRKFIAKTDNEIARYDSLVFNLGSMPLMGLSDRAKIDRNVCLTLAVNIRHILTDNKKQFETYVKYYTITGNRLRALNDYAIKRYGDIQSSIFVNGSDNYVRIIQRFSRMVNSTVEDVNTKYMVKKSQVRSQWDYRVILMLFAVIFIYGLVSVVLNILAIRYVMPKRFHTPSFLQKRACIIMATSVITLALILGVIKMVTSNENFLIMASGLMVQYTWLLAVILVSLLLRVDGSQIKSAFQLYSPLMLMGFLVISFRIVLIPNMLVNLIFPPILLICSLWQWNVVRKHNKSVPKSDMVYSYISLAVFTASVICSWFGYTLMAVQTLIWWIMQLTCILSITCVAGWIEGYARHKGYATKPVTQTWLFDFVDHVVVKFLAVASVVFSVYWAADVFNLSDTTWFFFTYKFINSSNFAVSIFGICQVVVLFFLFSYINKTTKAFLHSYFEKHDKSTAESRNVLWKNIVQILVWGAWFMISLATFHVSNTWLVVISGGLSTGVGFASKDILENIYYGISLMAGRIKIGDLIECDGIRGKVSSISYTSTMLQVADGSVIAFQNSQLFTKNYKNLTKNHGYELDKMEVGVAYGSNIAQVRQLLVTEVGKLDFLKKGSKPLVVVASLADSCVLLKVCCWVPVATFAACDSAILECIYNTLNSNNIEIPFPQLDVHKS